MVDGSAKKLSETHGQGDGSRRIKAWNPKVKTGCRTCKRRKVKCDETRPSCQRCIRARLSCEGYESPPRAWIFDSKKPVPLQPQTKRAVLRVEDAYPTPDTGASTSSSSSSDSTRYPFDAESFCATCGSTNGQCECADDGSSVTELPRTQPRSPNMVPSPISGPYRDAQEQQFFRYFIEVAGSSISRSGLSASFWLLSFPQAAWNQQSVRDALLSISTNFQSMAKEVFGEQPHEKTRRLSLGYQTQSLHDVVRNTPSVEFVLIISMGLWISSMLEGDYRKALQHCYYALKIVNSIRDRSKHDLLILKYAEAIGKAGLGYFRTTRGPCRLHPGGALLDCQPTCFEPEEMPLELRVADTLHHLRQMIQALVACEAALNRRTEPHSLDSRLRALIDRQIREGNFLITCWSDPDRLNITPQKLAEAAAVTPFTASPFPDILNALMDIIKNDGDSRFSFQEVELRVRILMPHITASTSRRSPILRADTATMLFFTTFMEGRLEVIQPWKKQIEMRIGKEVRP